MISPLTHPSNSLHHIRTLSGMGCFARQYRFVFAWQQLRSGGGYGVGGPRRRNGGLLHPRKEQKFPFKGEKTTTIEASVFGCNELSCDVVVDGASFYYAHLLFTTLSLGRSNGTTIVWLKRLDSMPTCILVLIHSVANYCIVSFLHQWLLNKMQVFI